MLAESHETLWISGIVQLPILGSEFEGDGVYQRGGSCAWSSSNSKWGRYLNKWVCHWWLYITIIIPLQIKVWQIYSYLETPSTKCRHLKNCPANHPKTDAHSKKTLEWLCCPFNSNKKTPPTNQQGPSNQWDFQGPPRTWDPLPVAYYSHTTPIFESLKIWE